MSSIIDVKNSLDEDYSAGYEINDELYKDFKKQNDDTIDQWLSNHYDELKGLKNTSKLVRSTVKESSGEDSQETKIPVGKLSEKTGLSLDRESPNYWQNIPLNDLKRIASANGYDYSSFSKAMMDETIDYNHKKTFQDFKNENPITNFIAESFFPNTYEGVKRITESGVGDKSDLYDDVAEDFVIGVGSSVSPLTKTAKTGKLVRTIAEGIHGGMFSFLSEGSQNFNYDKEISPTSIFLGAGFGAGGEAISAKKAGDILNGIFPENETVKGIGKKLEEISGNNNVSSAIDYVNAAKRKLNRYKNSIDNPLSDDFVRTSRNALNDGVSKTDAELAQEAIELFNYSNGFPNKFETYINLNPKETGPLSDLARFEDLNRYGIEGNLPKVTEKEISEAFSRHPLINKYDALIQNNPEDYLGGLFSIGFPRENKLSYFLYDGILKGAFGTAKTGAVSKMNVENTRDADLLNTKKLAEKKSENKDLEKKWMSGDYPKSSADRDYFGFLSWKSKNPKMYETLVKQDRWRNGDVPRNAKDPEWKEYNEWAKNNKEQAEQSKLLALFRY